VVGLLSGNQTKVQFGMIRDWPRVLDLSVLLRPPGLAEKRLAEVGQVVSHGAPQRHTFDFVEAADG
jgi:hypothetical protein